MRTLFSEDITVKINEKTLIDESRITINSETKYAVLGINGIGKTTLIKELIKKFNGIDYLYLEQDTTIEENQSCLEFVLRADPEGYEASLKIKKMENLIEMSDTQLKEYEELGELLQFKRWDRFEAEAKKILKGLQFSEQTTSELSGGWRMKLALAKALLRKPELLILDEPTNHLDLIACIWLSNYLAHYPKSIILITHDINITYEVSDVIWYIGNVDLISTKVYTIRGNFDHLQRFLNEEHTKHEKVYEKYTNALSTFKKKNRTKDEINDFIQRNSVPRPPKDYCVHINWSEIQSLSKTAISMKNISFSFLDNMIFNSIDFDILDDSRYVLVGRNGVGKTSLFKLCLGELIPNIGSDCIIKDSRLRIGYYHQQIMDNLPLNMTPIEYLQSINTQLNVGDCKSILGKMSLKKTDVCDPTMVKMSELSGGQKARVAFTRVAMSNPHVILLDEPTNHLDYESICGLVHGINEFNGGVVVITHDMYFIKSLKNVKILSVENQTIKEYKDGFESYYDRIMKEFE